MSPILVALPEPRATVLKKIKLYWQTRVVQLALFIRLIEGPFSTFFFAVFCLKDFEATFLTVTISVFPLDLVPGSFTDVVFRRTWLPNNPVDPADETEASFVVLSLWLVLLGNAEESCATKFSVFETSSQRFLRIPFSGVFCTGNVAM